jgi:hypothetical protein
VKVYDSSEPPQFLGILLGHDSCWPKKAAHIFVPSLNKTILIDLSDYKGDIVEDNSLNTLYYENPGCSGIPYVGGGRYLDMVIQKDSGTNHPYLPQYFMVRAGWHGIIAYSRGSSNGSCVEIPAGEFQDRLSEVVEVLVEDIPFTLRVTLPLDYEAD